MKVIKAAILGFGTVGGGVLKTINSHQTELQEVLEAEVQVVAVLVKNPVKERTNAEGVLFTTSFEEILNLPQLDVVFEAIVDKEPAFSYLKKAIEKGCHIITANKEMFAEHGQELLSLAEENGVRVGFEATVAGGVPIIQTMKNLLKVNKVQSVQGILNGTSNFILSEMRNKRCSFDEALFIAQQKGFAEADPENDIGGWDAYYKLRILSRIAFGDSLKQLQLSVTGIRYITIEHIEIAERLGLRFKHIAEVKKEGGRLAASVRPVLFPESHPLYHVEGVENAVCLTTDLLGELTLQGPGAGMLPTASAMVEDLVQLQQLAEAKATNRRSRLPLVTEQRESVQRYWLTEGLTGDLLTNEVEVCRVYDGNIQLIKATEAQLNEIGIRENNFSFFPIQGDGLANLDLQKEESFFC